MNLLRLTIIDPHGGISFVAPGEALPALLKACATDPPSLRPVKAGAVVFNLRDRRIITLQNGYQEITRAGYGEIFDGERMTGARFTYRLPGTWALVP